MSSIRIIAAITLTVGACASGNGSASDLSTQDAVLVEAGQELYRANCAVCHGVDLTGTGTGPSLLSEVYEPDHHSDFAFVQAVNQGSPAHHWNFGPMPPIEGLSESDLDALVAYVRENQRTRGFESYPPD
jgi:mono/diheme cytochrome c family protein